MPRFIRRLLLLSIVCAGVRVRAPAGTFGQIAYGGSWQTTFTLINVDSIRFGERHPHLLQDSGSPLNAPVQGFGSTSSYTFTIPPSGSTNVVLSSTDSTTTEGWASMTVTAARARARLVSIPVAERADLRSCGTHQHIRLGYIAYSVPAILESLILLPFDNTGGPISLPRSRLANTASATQFRSDRV